jgi:hypothetical protein
VQAYSSGQPLLTYTVPFTMSGITYKADFVAKVQRRTDGRYNTQRAIRRVERTLPHQVAPPEQTHTEHALIASESLQWTTQPTVIVTPSVTAATAAAAAAAMPRSTAAAGGSASSSSSSAAATTATSGVHKYELHGGLALNTSVTLDTVMFNLAAGLFERGMQPVVRASGAYGAPPTAGYAVPGVGYAIPNSGNGLVRKVDVYSSAVTTARYDAKRKEFAAQGISTAEIWVFHGTPTAANVHSIMTEGFKVTELNLNDKSFTYSKSYRLAASGCITMYYSVDRDTASADTSACAPCTCKLFTAYSAHTVSVCTDDTVANHSACGFHYAMLSHRLVDVTCQLCMVPVTAKAFTQLQHR